MKKLSLLLFFSLHMLAMNDFKMLDESDVNWDKEAFDSAWSDPEKMRVLKKDFDVHVSFLVACGAAERVFKAHHEKCTCLEDETADVSACASFESINEHFYESKVISNTSNIPALWSLLGSDKPSENGAIIYGLLRKTSYALAHYTIDAYLSGSDDTSNSQEPIIYFTADEKKLLKQTVFPLFDEDDVSHLRRITVSPVSRRGSLKKIDTGYESPIVQRKVEEKN